MESRVAKPKHEPISADVDRVAKEIVDAAYKVHSALGPGLMEKAYEECLVHELVKRGLKVQRQVSVPVEYDGINLSVGFRIDLLVEGRVVVELKACDGSLQLHRAQLLTYLKLSGHRLGLLINFNVPTIKQGIDRLVR